MLDGKGARLGSRPRGRKACGHALDASGVAAELIDSERRVATEKAREAGKPEAMIEKIVENDDYLTEKYLMEIGRASCRERVSSPV